MKKAFLIRANIHYACIGAGAWAAMATGDEPLQKAFFLAFIVSAILEIVAVATYCTITIQRYRRDIRRQSKPSKQVDDLAD